MFQERTRFDLFCEYQVDQYEKKPLETHRNAQGDIQLTNTGDNLVDKWEEQIAKGEIPDLFEAFDEESITHMERLRQAARDRDPYQGMTMKETSDKMQREATREGLHVGPPTKGMTPEKQKMLEELFNNPTFGGDFDE